MLRARRSVGAGIGLAEARSAIWARLASCRPVFVIGAHDAQARAAPSDCAAIMPTLNAATRAESALGSNGVSANV
jgi:hypothetical protein